MKTLSTLLLAIILVVSGFRANAQKYIIGKVTDISQNPLKNVVVAYRTATSKPIPILTVNLKS